MINRFLIITLFTCACFVSQAQVNLVKNPSFEQYSICPYNAEQVSYANYWSGIDSSWVYFTSPDPQCNPEYVNTCSTVSVVTSPDNIGFYHYPRTGNGMIGIRTYNDGTGYGYVTTTYLQGRLYAPLIAGQSYCVTFYVVRMTYTGYANNNIDAYLDNGSIDTASVCHNYQTEYTPQILDTTIVTDTLNWTKIQGSFIANGTERCITIGDFFDTAHTEHIKYNSEGSGDYLIDDVSVIASNATAYAGPDQTITIGCSTYIGVDSSGDGMPCYWYVLGGTTAIDSGGTILVNPLTTTTYVVSMDLCGTVTYDTVTVNVTPCTGPPVVSFTDTGSSTVGFTYTGVTGCIDTISWNFGDGSTSNAVNPIHTYSAVGTYTVCVTDYTYCGSNSACQTVTIVCPTPVASFSDTGTTTVGFTYTGTITSLDSVVWNFGDGSTGTGMNPVHTYSVAGTYTVCVTAYTGCGNDTVCGVVNISLKATSISPQGGGFSVYPNPASGELNIEGAAGCEVRIYNVVGEEVRFFTSIRMTNREVINISDLVDGVYIVRITDGMGEQKNVRLLKE